MKDQIIALLIIATCGIGILALIQRQNKKAEAQTSKQ